MALEIERKFLVRDVSGEGALPAWKRLAEDPEGTLYRQGYLSRDPDRTVRVRIAGDKARLTVKGRTTGCTRSEFEYPIPLEDARRMLDELVLPPVLEKRRYRVPLRDTFGRWTNSTGKTAVSSWRKSSSAAKRKRPNFPTGRAKR